MSQLINTLFLLLFITLITAALESVLHSYSLVRVTHIFRYVAAQAASYQRVRVLPLLESMRYTSPGMVNRARLYNYVHQPGEAEGRSV